VSDPNQTVRDWLGALTLEQMAEAFAGDLLPPPGLVDQMPKMPPEAWQLVTVGKSGVRAMREAVDFTARCMQEFNSLNPIQTPRVLDFGTGWGRIARCFLRWTPETHITGSDVRSESFQTSRELMPTLTFMKNDVSPPLDLASGSMDIITAYSVFSHLSESSASRWIEEFARVLSPGGIAFITTRPRLHLEACKEEAEKNKGAMKQYAKIFEDYDKALAAYDNGEFVYSPLETAEELTGDFYGEAIVPRSFIEKNWSAQFVLQDWITTYSKVAIQPLIVLQKR
jgi:ubiquinone/menaquinone biosynthesis C-methylase UbiE